MLQEGLASGKQVQRIGIAIGGGRHRPLIAEAFPVNMEVRAGISVSSGFRCGGPSRSRRIKDNRLPNPILVGGLGEFDLRAGHVEHEILPFVDGC
jgi:hypothetical protein